MASIETRERKSGGTSYRVVWRDPDTRRKDSLTFDDYNKAERFKGVLEACGHRLSRASEVATAIEAREPTVKEVTERHITDLTGISERTRADYRRDAANHIYPHLGHYPISAPTESTIAWWVNKLAGTMSGKTLANQHGLLSSVFQSAATKYKLREDNPCRGMRLPAHDPEEMVFLTTAEFGILYRHIRPHYQPFVMFLVGTGCRWGEATAVPVGAFDFRARQPTVRIYQAWKRDENCRWYIGPTKTKNGRRTIALGEELVSTLAPLAEGRAADELMFVGPKGGRLHSDHFRERHWKRAVDAATATHDKAGNPIPPDQRLTKVPRIHDLRHTHASWMVAEGVDLPTVMRRLGHKNITTTVNTYGHLTPGQLAATATATDSTLREALMPPLRLVS